MKNKSTDDMMSELMKANHINEYIKNNETDMISPNLKEHLDELLLKKNLDKKDVIKASDLNAIYAYQIFAGVKTPSRDKLLQLCFGMRLSVEEAQSLLKANGYAPLYAKDKRDSVVIFALNNGKSVIDTNIGLEANGFSPLGEKK